MPTTYTNGTLATAFTGLTAARRDRLIEGFLQAEGVSVAGLTLAQKLDAFHEALRRYIIGNVKSWESRAAAEAAKATAETEIALT